MSPPCSPTSPCPGAAGWRSSATPAARASWRPTPAVADGLEVPELSAHVQDDVAGGPSLRGGIAQPGRPRRRRPRPTPIVAASTCCWTAARWTRIVVIFTPPLGTRADDVASAVVQAVDGRRWTAGRQVPVVATFLGAPSAAARPPRRRAVRFPASPIPRRPCGRSPTPSDYAQWRARPPGTVPHLDGVDANEARRRVLAAVGEGSGEWITGADAMEVLAAYGIDCVPTISVCDADEAVRCLDRRTAGGAEGLRARSGPQDGAWAESGSISGPKARCAMPLSPCGGSLGPAMTGAVVQPMVHGGVETIAGFVVDPAFGPQVLFGLGGTAVELLGDSVSRLTPLTDLDARDMVLGLRATPLLTGFRGSKPVDVEALVDLVLRLGRLADDLPELIEADCNPVMATPGGAMVVDARLRVTVQPELKDDARQLK